MQPSRAGAWPSPSLPAKSPSLTGAGHPLAVEVPRGQLLGPPQSPLGGELRPESSVTLLFHLPGRQSLKSTLAPALTAGGALAVCRGRSVSSLGSPSSRSRVTVHRPHGGSRRVELTAGGALAVCLGRSVSRLGSPSSRSRVTVRRPHGGSRRVELSAPGQQRTGPRLSRVPSNLGPLASQSHNRCGWSPTALLGHLWILRTARGRLW